MTSIACVALVDDDASVRVALRRLLRLADYEVADFASGSEFLASLVARLPDCAVVDVHMPALSGFDVHRGMQSAGIELPVVFITASDDLALESAVREAGGIRLLRKPFSNDDFLAAVAASLRHGVRN